MTPEASIAPRGSDVLRTGRVWYTRCKSAMKGTSQASGFKLKVEFSREVGGRWIADIPALPGVTVYGRTRKQALAGAEALALRVIADRLEHGEAVPGEMTVSFAA